MVAIGVEEKYLTSREAELLIDSGATSQVQRDEAHKREHEQQQEAINKALQAENNQQTQHNVAHDKAHDAHEEKHKSEDASVKTALNAVDRERNIHAVAHDKEHFGHTEIHKAEQKAVDIALAAGEKAVKTALDAVGRERDIHAAAHDRAHAAHDKEHELNKLAIEKAEQASDKRFAAVNATREQMSDILRTLATKESVDSLLIDKTRRWEENRKELDRRFDEMRIAITNIEKGDVKQEGKSLGQGAVVAIIVGAVGFVGTVLGIIIIVANIITG